MVEDYDNDESLVFAEDELPEDPDELEEGDLVAVGTHDVVCVSLKKQDGDPDKAPVLSTRWKVEGGESDGQSLFHNIFLPFPGEKNGTRRGRQLMLKRLGLISEEDFKTGGTRVDYGRLKGLEATVEIIHKEYKGKTYANVSFGGWHERGWTPEAAAAEKSAKPVDEFDDV